MDSHTPGNGKVVKFLQKVVEKLTPVVTEAVERGSSGHFEIHFSKGEYSHGVRKDGF